MINTYKGIERRLVKYNIQLTSEFVYYKVKYLNTILKYSNKLRNNTKEIKRIVNEPIYKEAIDNIDIKTLNKRRKLLVIFARLKFYYGIKLLYKIKK